MRSNNDRRVIHGHDKYTNTVVRVGIDQAAIGNIGIGNKVCSAANMPIFALLLGRYVWRQRPAKERPWAQVVKGGSFYSRQKGALAAQFFELLPELVSDQFRVGFRCVRD